MPKRVRCPHCDRLFTRDRLDDHIHKCRARTTNRGEVRRTRKAVVVDGNNVAHHLSSNGVPRVANLVLAQSSLLKAGLKPIVVVSAALKHKIDDPEVLQEMIASREVIEAPRGTDDDLTVIKLAQSNNADIVSNDRFLGFINRYPWLQSRLMKYRMTPSGLILR